MYSPDLSNLLLLQPHPAQSERSETHIVPYNTEFLNSLTAGDCWTDIYCTLHDPVCEVGVELRVPVANLVAAAQYGTAS